MSASSFGQETIPIMVSKQAAAFFRSLSEERRNLIEVLLDQTLEDAMTRSDESLRVLMKRASSQAKRRGLTPKILEQILNEN